MSMVGKSFSVTQSDTMKNHRRAQGMTRHGIRFVWMGSCRITSSNTFVKCAVEPSDCDEDQNQYFTGHDEDQSVISRCNTNNRRIGRCLKENTCAVREIDCAEDTDLSNFDENDASCTYQRDRSVRWNVEDPQYTLFGSCLRESGEHFCVFDPSECDEEIGEVYKTSSETAAAGVECDCSNVHVYACNLPGLSMELSRVLCAVKANGCRDTSGLGYGYEALSPRYQRDLRETNRNDLDCRLCQQTNTPEPTPSPTTKTKKPTNHPTTRPTKSVQPTMETAAPTIATVALVENTLKEANTSKDGNDAMLGVIVGGSIGSLVLIGALAFVYYRSLFKPAKHNKKKSAKSSGLPGEISMETLDDIPK